MDDSKWARYAVLGGPWFVVLTLVGGFLAGSPPAIDATDEKVAAYFADNTGAIQAGQLLAGLGAIGLAWWFGSVWRRMSDAEGERHRMSVVALLGLALGGALALGSGALTAAVAQRHVDLGAGGVRFFYALSFMMVAMASVGLVVMIAAVSSLSYRTGLFPKAANYLGWLAALAALIGMLSLVTDASAVSLIGFIGFILFALWILEISWELWKRP